MGGGTVAHAASTPTPTVAASSTTSEESQSASQQAANEVNEKATTSESVSTNVVSQNDSQSKVVLSSQTSGSQQPVITNQLKESKIAEPTKQVTATLNIYDYDANDPKRTDGSNQGEEIAFSYTGKFNEGSIKDAIQAQIDADTQKQLAYKDQGTAIIPDKDGLPTEIGVSPVISAPFSDNDLGGYFFRDKTTNTYQQNNQTQLVDAYNKWLDYKKAHFALAGYKLADQDPDGNPINLDDPIEDGKTYNIYVNHQLSVVNVYHWTELKRTVEFKYYYKQDDKNAQAADSVTKNGYYNDGKYNQAQPKQFINATGEPVFSNLPKTSNTVNQTDISDANSFETRLLPDDLKTTKDQTKVLHDTINSRYIDLAVGLITDNQGQLNNYGKATPIYPSGTILFEGEPVKQIDNWHTFDPNVPDTGSDYIYDINTYSTVQGSFNKGTGDNIDPVNNPATTTIYYYHDQPVDITFEDVTNGDANAPVLSNFTASKDLRVDLNAQYRPGAFYYKNPTNPKDKKWNEDHKSQYLNMNYETYSYQATDNTYNTNAINVDPSDTLKSSSSLNYDDILKAYTDHGYALVSSDPDDLTYELEDVYDNNRNLQHKKRVVKLVHRAVAHNTDTKTAIRTIHYVANSKNGNELQDSTTQNVTLTSSTYYTDALTGHRVNAKQDANGDWIVDTTNTDPIPTLTWTVDSAKSSGVSDNTQDFAAVTTPDTINLTGQEAASRKVDEGAWYLVDTDSNGQVSYGDPTSDSWKTDTPNKVADGYLIYKQKAQYNIHYIDVNGVDKTTYEPTDGKELKDHEVTGVGSEDKTYVGDTPDATAKLWSPTDYEKAGYVLVGLSDNAKGDLLGKQTLTKNVQDQYVYLKHQVVEVTPHTPDGDIPSDPKDSSKPSVDKNDLSKSYTRNIYYKAKTADGPTLKDQTTQKVTFEASVYVDKVTHETSGVETVTDANGKQVQVANGKQGKVTWNKTIVDGDATKLSDASARFNSVDQPTIDLEKGNKYATSDDMTGTWYLVDGEANELDLAPDSTKPEDKTLVYKQKAQYNIHYIDVYGVEDAADYNTKGKELSDHLVQNVGEGKDIYVGDTPDATAKLWSPADYEKAGYVLVGLSDNAKGDLLGKQTLTKNVQDQYVYLNHKAVEITSKTPNPPENSSVKPEDLTKSAERIIHYVTEKDKATLLNDTPQKITFEGTAYIDMVNGKNSQTVEGTDALTGQKVLVALTTPGKITWTAIAGDGSIVDNNKGSFNQVTKPVITITDGKLAGTWTVTGATANNAKQDGTDLDPASNDFDPHREVTLEYTKDVNADIIYIDDTDKKVLIPTAQDTDEHGKSGQDVHFAQDPQKTIANFENQGYILVRDDFGKGQKYGETDRHYEIHFVHGVTKNVEHKSAVRIIHYVTDDGDQVLLDPTTQDQVSFTKTTYTDKVTHKTVGVKEVRDSERNTVQASDNIETTPSWVVDGKDSFDQVTKPVITITDGKLAGKWLVTEATANNAPEFTVPDPSDQNFKEVYDVTLKYVQNVNADITYWDITDGMDHKVQLGNTDPASDSEGRTGELIHFNNNEKRISNLQSQNYVFVDTDYHPTDKYGKETSHFNVYFRHAVKDITPNTPVEDVPKDSDGKPAIDQKSLHKEFTRNITFVANNDAKSLLMDRIPQKVTFDGHVYVDMVTGQTTTPETVKDAKGNNVQVATTKAGNIEWNHDTQDMAGIIQQYITLNKGDKYATSDDMVGTWHWISGTANEITLKPTSDNPEDCVLVYEKNRGESGPDESHDLPTVDIKQETKTFTRTIVYRGTKDGGVHYESVNGSPDGKNTYKQTVTFTRNVFSTTDKDGKVTILETDPWTAKDATFGEVISKTPGEVGYDEVDIKAVNARTIDPDKDNPNLGTITVTYRATPAQPTEQPTAQPTEQPTSQPTEQPTEQPTSQPTAQPTEQPTAQPTSQPTVQPTEQPTSQPTAQPTSQPTAQPTSQPTEQSTSQPTVQPTERPSEQPTAQPTVQPTEQPTSQPTVQPTEQPTSQPSEQPTSQPSEQPAIESNTQLPSEQKNEEPQPMTTQVTAKKGETSIVEPTKSSSTQPTTKQGAQQLPQTGNQRASSLIGLGFAGLLSSLGLTKVNKKRKD